MTKPYDLAVLIGRFSPPHRGHLAVIEAGFEQAKNVIILIGSATSARSYRNPFSYKERKTMIMDSLPGDLKKNLHIHPLSDKSYNDAAWITDVQNIVERTAWEIGHLAPPKVALIGHSKDKSSYYLRLFPQWDSIDVPNYMNINSTDIRTEFFGANGGLEYLQRIASDDTRVMGPVKSFLEKFVSGPNFEKVKQEYDFVAAYKKSWENVPYPVIFTTVDCCVVQSGHVLMIRRRASPGKGLWALPGGFIGHDELIVDAAIRELREETGIKVPEPVLRGSIVAREVFDDPHRSSRGRTITHGFLIKLRDDVVLPKVRGSDDADRARWIPISALKQEDCFDDHHNIIQKLLGYL
jgi:bifunctional NMN adenylyltransferase/nudix hydrolase